MGRFDERKRQPFSLDAGADWDDWDPSRAREGYTGHIRALRQIGQPHDPALQPPTPLSGPLAPSGSRGLSAAAQAIVARAEREDYLTVAHDLREPGFAEVYDALLAPQWSAPFARLLLSVFLTLPRARGAQVLDVACGAGIPTLDLARFLGADCDLAGLDLWDEAIHLARRKAADEWLRNVAFVIADVVASGLPEDTFDTITCNLGLGSFADRPAALGAMRSLLRPQGQLLLTTPLQSALREFLDSYYLTLRDLKLEQALRDLTRLIDARPTTDVVRQLVEQAGFKVQRAVTDAFALRFADSGAFFHSLLIQTTYLDEWRALLPDVTIRRLVFNEVERRLRDRAAANGGELVMTVPMLCLSAVRA
jgi:demethylmenaquinone methyltransferase/2-methoxy-6-polyprenyl-1,4-benzoquinol methylase